MAQPVIQPGQYLSQATFSEMMIHDFNSLDGPLSGAPEGRIWKPLDMTEGLHKAGNSGIDRDGNLVVDSSAHGARWSGWYDEHQDTVSRIVNGQLHMRGLLVNEVNNTRRSYTHKSELIEVDTIKVFMQYLCTWDRVYSQAANDGAGGLINDPDYNLAFLPEVGETIIFEERVSLAQMSTRSFRKNLYLLPAREFAGDAYNNDPGTVEVDIYEYDATAGQLQKLLMKVIAGETLGNTIGSENGTLASDFGFDLRNGFHTISLAWTRHTETTGVLVWSINGIEVIRDTRLVPNRPHYLVMARELNSGADLTPGPGGLQAIPPYIPHDYGLYGEHFWFDRAQINNGDVAIVDHLRVFTTGRAVVPEVVTTEFNQPYIKFHKTAAGERGSIFECSLVIDPRQLASPGFDLERVTFAWSHDLGARLQELGRTDRQTFIAYISGNVTVDTVNNVFCDYELNQVA